MWLRISLKEEKSRHCWMKIEWGMHLISFVAHWYLAVVRLNHEIDFIGIHHWKLEAKGTQNTKSPESIISHICLIKSLTKSINREIAKGLTKNHEEEGKKKSNFCRLTDFWIALYLSLPRCFGLPLIIVHAYIRMVHHIIHNSHVVQHWGICLKAHEYGTSVTSDGILYNSYMQICKDSFRIH